LAYAIGRIGCQVSGDGDWGIVNDLPKPSWIPQKLWAFDYPHNIINEGIPIPGCVEKHCYVLEQAVFPTPVYETMMGLFFFGLLIFLQRKLVTPGMIISLYLIFNGLERFFIEKIRVNTKFNLLGYDATQAEIVAVIFFLAGVIGLWLSRQQGVELLRRIQKKT